MSDPRKLSPEHRSKIAASVSATMTPERRAEIAKRTRATMTPERRAQIAQQVRDYHARARAALAEAGEANDK